MSLILFGVFFPLINFILWIIRASGCIDTAEEKPGKNLKQPETKPEQIDIEFGDRQTKVKIEERVNQSEIRKLITEIGKESHITKEQINAYSASFLDQGITTRNALYRCSEQDVESLIKKAGMKIGHKNAMIDIWLARESKADEEDPKGISGLDELDGG